MRGWIKNCHRRRSNMAKKTAVKRRQEKQENQNQYWEKFSSILQEGQDCGEALALALAMPQDFTVPKESNPEERSLYLELIRRFEAGGEVKPGVRRQFEQALEANSAGAQ